MSRSMPNQDLDRPTGVRRPGLLVRSHPIGGPTEVRRPGILVRTHGSCRDRRPYLVSSINEEREVGDTSDGLPSYEALRHVYRVLHLSLTSSLLGFFVSFILFLDTQDAVNHSNELVLVHRSLSQES